MVRKVIGQRKPCRLQNYQEVIQKRRLLLIQVGGKIKKSNLSKLELIDVICF